MANSLVIRNRLKEVRQSKGFRTQRDLAARLNVGQTSISAIENDDNFVSKELLASLCETLQCDVGDIFFADAKNN